MNVSKVTAFLLSGASLALALPAATASAASPDAAAHQQVLASPDSPLSSTCFKKPSFTPAFPGTTLSRDFEVGNWHYEISYKYDPQKRDWDVAEFKAHRIRMSHMTPVPASMWAAKAASIEAKTCPIDSLPLE
ncbi:MAG: hypothetical protein ACRES7_04520 [Gammaproteobacteria bacterium]